MAPQEKKNLYSGSPQGGTHHIYDKPACRPTCVTYVSGTRNSLDGRNGRNLDFKISSPTPDVGFSY